MRVGLVGCGRISTKHIDALESLKSEGLNLVSICDSDPVALQSCPLGSGVSRFSSMEEMLNVGGLDVIVIATPSGLHKRHVLLASGRVPFIVVEKPLALSLDDAEEMVAATKKAGSKLFVVKQNRYNTAVQEVRSAVESGSLGDLHLGTARLRWTRRQAYYDQASWRGTRLLDGSVIWNQASHHLDLLSLFMGPVQSVFSYGQKSLADIEVEDTVVSVAKFSGNRLGVIEATTAVRPKDLEGSLSLFGSTGYAVIGGFAVNEVQDLQFESNDLVVEEIRKKSSENPPDVYGYGHRKFYSHLLRHIVEEEPFELAAEDSLETVRLLEMVERSVQEGREIVR